MTKSIQKLKIAFVLDDGLDRPDGVQQNILTLGKWLSSDGHAVHYLVGETKRRDIPNVHSMARNIRVRFNGNKLTIPLYAPKKNITKILNAEKFDMLHVQMPYHPFCGARIVKLADPKTAIVGTFHILDYSPIVNLSTKLLGLYLNQNLKKFDQFMSVSRPAKEFARQSFKISSSVLSNPVDAKKYKPSQKIKRDKDLVRLVFVGRLVPRKGCMKLLEAICMIKSSQLASSSFHLDICGDGQLRSELEEFVLYNNLKPFVTFHGFITEDAKVKILQNADIAVYPSIAGESFGIVLIEAMAAGTTAVFGGDNPGYRSVLGEVPESLFDPMDETSLAQKLSDYINDLRKRQNIYSKQQELLKKFDVETVGCQLLKIYRDCIADKNGR